LNAAIDSDESLGKHLECNVANAWNSFGPGALTNSLKNLIDDPDSYNWRAHFVLHEKDHCIIGNGGYKGAPDAKGKVEIGYEISPGYRNQGYATEMVGLLVNKADRDHRIKKILAYTLSTYNASTRVLRKQGFIKTSGIEDAENGWIWRWELER
jgi:RimJ/RimL family protein N-acetyltransferase